MNSPPAASGHNPAQVFEDFYVPSVFRPWAGELLDRATLKAGERVLDVACGTGIVARLVALQIKGGVRVTGLDYNPSMLEIARSVSAQEHAEIEWVEGNAEQLPFPDASFDLVLIQQGLQFFRDKARAVGEMYRVLTPGGRIATSTWTDIDNNPFNKVVAEEIRRHLGIIEVPLAFSLGNREELTSLFVEAGFAEIGMVTVRRDVHYPSPDRFIELGVESASVAVADLANMDAASRAALVSAMRMNMAGTIKQYTVGDELVAPMEAHIAIARKANQANSTTW